MAHLSEGTVRRLYDEPQALGEGERAHYRACPDCQGALLAAAAQTRRAMGLLAVGGATVDLEAALARHRALMSGAGPDRAGRWRVRLGGWGWRRPALAGALAAGVAGALALTPLAQTLVQVFQPTQVSTVSIARGDLSGLDAFSGWGTVKSTAKASRQDESSAAAAAAASGLPEIHVDPSKLPPELAGAPVSYIASAQGGATVTFTDKAPAKLRGSTLTVRTGPAEATVFGDLSKLRAAGRSDQDARQVLSQAGPVLAVVAVRAPQVTSSGVSVADIKQALLAQPNLSPGARAEIQALDSPTGNLPIPVPLDRASARTVTVQNVQGAAIGDNTGLGAGVVWIKNGVIHAVAGTVSVDQALAVAGGVS